MTDRVLDRVIVRDAWRAARASYRAERLLGTPRRIALRWAWRKFWWQIKP